LDKLTHKRKLAAALRRKEELARQTCFNPFDLQSSPTAEQAEAMEGINDVFQRFVVGGNQSGKSNLGARECSWVFTNTHPFWKNKPDRPLTMLVVGKTHKIVKEELWENKIKQFIGNSGYRIYKDGNSLDRVVHDNGNRILFFSHDAPDVCRQRVQGFVADWVWLDEMPGSYSLLQELFARCQANKAPFIATFTPLLKNQEIRKHVDEGNRKFIRKYTLKTLDNPFYDEEKKEMLLANWENMSETERLTRSEGAWYTGDSSVYDFIEEKHVHKPAHYHPSWRHLEAIDPASAGKAGFALLAEDPQTKVWYVIRDEYIEGKAPSELLQYAIQYTEGVNLVKRVCDSHEAGYIKEANLQKVFYEIPQKKTQRKKELITGLQEALHKGRLKVAPWCQKTKDEFMTCQWAESGDRIVNARSYHMLDCLQYAIDVLPEPVREVPAQTIYQMMRDKHYKRKEVEAQKAKKEATRSYARIQPRRSRWR
jgi:phage terminase large subunit-like protein